MADPHALLTMQRPAVGAWLAIDWEYRFGVRSVHAGFLVAEFETVGW